MRIPTAFVFGALAATLVAAAAFRGAGQPVDSTFTYQGQLRNAGQLVNGNVDVRFTLWDSDVGGTQVGNANSFTNYPLTDGRFALGLNFGMGAFNGDQRWVQVEFRSPAGVGQFLTLNPRDKIMATPYALYALNGTASQWDYNPKTQSLTAAANVSKVGIGTSTPTAALEVVSATGGDESVRLPVGSVGPTELAIAPASFSNANFSVNNVNPVLERSFTVSSPMQSMFFLHANACGSGGTCGSYVGMRLKLDGVVVWEITFGNGCAGTLDFIPVNLGTGAHTLRLEGFGNSCFGWSCDARLQILASYFEVPIN
jgi:hypothetical protein